MAEPRKPDIKKSILNRVRMLYILFFAVGVAIAGKILYIQYGPGGESLRSKGERISYERVAIEADRGDVLAWDGRLLATSRADVRSADGFRGTGARRFGVPQICRFAGRGAGYLFRRQKQERLPDPA